ncbi:GNAT family N-acetyltransferase [Zobellia sp. B3R18]|uniref:GNAT family N-acetyltransferase n=1 Tax=Zobellia sp. B3R18 TaxID=2841568 RepID=UPI00352FC935
MSRIQLSQIITKRLILNQPSLNDLEKISSILNASELYSKNTINIPFPYTLDNAKFWVKLADDGLKNQDQYIFAIRLKESNELIGGIDLGIDKPFNKAELGYWLDQKYWNNGFTTEAVKSIIQFGFEELKLKRIFATHFTSNLSSGRVMEKAGMKKEGILKCHTYKAGVYQDHVLYAVLNE